MRSDETKTQAGSISEGTAFDIVTAEFNYVAQTAFQANEDRARVSQLFFVTFGTVIAALYSSQLSPEDANLREVYYGFALLFVAITLYGMLTLLQLVRLREAWRDSVNTMNEMKRRVAGACPEVQQFLVWGIETAAPPLYKPWSVGFMMAVTVSALTGIAAGAATAFWGLGLQYDGSQGEVAWLPVLGVGLALGLGSMLLFRNRLRRG